MNITRRGWLGAGAAIAGASVGAATVGAAPALAAEHLPTAAEAPAGDFLTRAPGGARDYGPALAALGDYARAELAAYGLPGMTLAVTDQDGFTAVLGLGWADRERRIPVNPGHYFQVGSISKSFIALTVLTLADQGRLDVDAPLALYLPDAALPAEAITVAQLLSHTAGLPDNAPLFPRTPDGRLWCGFAPGSIFSYSNTGYRLLGRLIERVAGMPHKLAVAMMVRDRLGLEGVAGTISQARRGDFAVGYWPANRSVAAALPGDPQEVAYWTEEDNPAGSIGATSDQMAVYLRALLRLGRGQGAPVLSDAAARRFATPVIGCAEDFGPGARYACGVAVVPVDGVPCLHHTGGMMSFSSSFHADSAAGVACFASVNARNAGYRPRMTTAYAVRLLRAVRARAPLPPAPDPLASYRFKDAELLHGHYVAEDGAFELAPDGRGVSIHAFETTARIIPQGPDRLLTNHPRLARHGLDVVRENGEIVGYWWGDTLFGRGAPRPRPAPGDRLRALAGDYLDRDPWVGGATVLVRGDTLVVDGAGRLVDRGGWWSALRDPGGVERLRFDGLLNGQAQRLNVSGADLLRLAV